jgi:hypothetical protein
MIHVRTWIGDSVVPEPPTIQFTLTEREDLLKFKILLNRALNVAPEFGADWFKLCDKLEEFLERHNIT